MVECWKHSGDVSNFYYFQLKKTKNQKPTTQHLSGLEGKEVANEDLKGNDKGLH